MRRKPIFPMTLEELKVMHTGSLLSRLKQLQMCEESVTHSDIEGDEGEGSQIQFKDTPVWKRAYRDLKEVLADREHLPGAAERRERRQKRCT